MNKRVTTLAVLLAAFPAGVGVSLAASGEQGPPHPGCKPSNNTPPKCRTTSTVTVTEPGTTSTETVTSPPVTVTLPAPPAPPPVVVVTPGSPGTVTITITINGSTTTTTVPGSMPGTLPTCVNTRKSAIMGPLPRQFRPGMRVSITTKGHSQFRTVRAQRKVFVNTSNLPCGVYPIAVRSVNHPKLKPAWRIWSFTGGNTLNRFWFPGIPGFSNF